MKIQLPVLAQAKEFKKINQRKIRHLRDLKDLDYIMENIHNEVFSEIDCLTCANCCRTTGPLFTQKDIDRIAKHLRMKSGAFIQQYLYMDEDGDFVLQSVPCTFLQSNNECSIYEYRPKACREYPHTNQTGQKKIFDLTMKNMEICPAALEIVNRAAQKLS